MASSELPELKMNVRIDFDGLLFPLSNLGLDLLLGAVIEERKRRGMPTDTAV